jgi:hypothetical protein
MAGRLLGRDHRTIRRRVVDIGAGIAALAGLSVLVFAVLADEFFRRWMRFVFGIVGILLFTAGVWRF